MLFFYPKYSVSQKLSAVVGCRRIQCSLGVNYDLSLYQRMVMLLVAIEFKQYAGFALGLPA